MSGPKLITEFDNLIAMSTDQLISVGDPSTGVLYATAVGHFLLGASGSVYGFQGNQGWQGSVGYQGWQGSQGWQGFGSTGNQGWQGHQGFQGSQGWQGVGATGTQGSQGVQGSLGGSNILSSYLPILENSSNVVSSTISYTSYTSITCDTGTWVSVWGEVIIESLSIGVNTLLKMSLPVSDVSISTYSCALAGVGSFVPNSNFLNSVRIYYGYTSSQAIFEYYTIGITASKTISFNYSYSGTPA